MISTLFIGKFFRSDDALEFERGTTVSSVRVLRSKFDLVKNMRQYIKYVYVRLFRQINLLVPFYHIVDLTIIFFHTNFQPSFAVWTTNPWGANFDDISNILKPLSSFGEVGKALLLVCLYSNTSINNDEGVIVYIFTIRGQKLDEYMDMGLCFVLLCSSYFVSQKLRRDMFCFWQL